MADMACVLRVSGFRPLMEILVICALINFQKCLEVCSAAAKTTVISLSVQWVRSASC